MAQFYFLSILFNSIAGFVLIYGTNNLLSQDVKTSKSEKKQISSNKAVTSILDNEVLRLVTGILCVFVGLMKILSVFRNDIPVIGDLLPALTGLLSGFTLLFEYYVLHASTEIVLSEFMTKMFINSRKYIGILTVFIAVLHFVFPQVILL